VPASTDVATARETIASGGAHKTMPVWGNVLTPEQLDALVKYTLDAAKGTPLEVGQKLFAQNCAACHGDFGEGGPNPSRPGSIIVPIGTGEFLKTRDDATLRSIIAQGQPNFGMSPFASANGGPLSADEVDALVAYIRSWEAKPPVELPPDIAVARVSLDASNIFAQLCAQCHGPNGEGGVGPALGDSQFQAKNTDQDIFNTIDKGHAATPMIAWGAVLTPDQIQQLVAYIRQLGKAAPSATGGPLTFVVDVKPIFDAKCSTCHGKLGGWDASSYDTVMKTGVHAPVVNPGDANGSLLAQKIQGTQARGTSMPPAGKLSDAEIKIILAWINVGAPEK
jgi:mono/diheme cytochrome c family protein